MRLLLFFLAFVPPPGAAVCECGYSVQGPPDGRADGPWLFTDALESDFTRIANISRDRDWVRQRFDVSAEAGRGKYGKAFDPANVVSRPRPRTDDEGEPPRWSGLELRVGGALEGNAVPVAEVDSSRLDMQWGSYRAAMKLPTVSGTCSAFFWYWNDTQEIDMEFLSREFDASKKLYPVNLVIQSPKSMEAGYDASKTGTFKRVNLGFDPTDGFHEYRFDYLPGRVLFYADSQMLTEMTGDVMPSGAGHVILQHWSNGNPLWSGGPPTQDALLTVSYVKAYFNSSGSAGLSAWSRQCSDTKTTVCAVQDTAADAIGTGGHFFTDQRNKSSGGDDENKGPRRTDPSRGAARIALLAMSLMLMMS
ncbi:glycoside hydrolase family 16 protein [Drechmeria coniospora]|uniref:Glycoside hydrolase family 16 protein n=1 Tax=Drechmeria coniospora TaxID=98403 RepID=A0A151GBZ8_DRECN|nr:glycoside hydrolase family 16 protein [Drechmeria coniospora]KYK54583.1 glycoside hydrolase family 16 protein [Drechmeria coniospora]ODA80491.1 hypothetical protein RJ55_03449 [Drechmeria coniospora]